MLTFFIGRKDEVLREDVAKNVTPEQLNKVIAPRSRLHEHAALLPSPCCHLAMKKPDFFFCEGSGFRKGQPQLERKEPGRQ